MSETFSSVAALLAVFNSPTSPSKLTRNQSQIEFDSSFSEFFACSPLLKKEQLQYHIM